MFLQNKLLHYRKPFYNQLSKYYTVSVLHSGCASANSNDLYQEIIVPCRKLGGFYWQNQVFKEALQQKYDYVVIMADIRWTKNILLAFIFRIKKRCFLWWGLDFGQNKIINSLKVFLMSGKQPIVLYNDKVKEVCVNRGFNEKRLFVANNTFHVEIRERCYLNKRKDVVLFVGSFDARKQNLILIEAFSEVLSEIESSINLVFIGGGQEEQLLKAHVKKLGLTGRVEFIGSVNDTNQLVEYYKRALVSVSFGQAGLSVLQALAYGVPFLTKKNAITGGEKNNIKHGVNGILCEDSLCSLKTSILDFCKNKMLTREMGKAAYDYYTEYCTMRNMVGGMLEAFENA